MAFKNIKWAEILFGVNTLICVYLSLVAVVLALEVPRKYTLIILLSPILTFFAATIIFRCILRWSFTNWKELFDQVSKNRTHEIIVKSIFLPILLCGLSFYLRGDMVKANLFAISPVHCEMIIHTCGSSVGRINNQEVVWDSADLISQPSDSEVFVITNALVAVNQTQGECLQTGTYCSTTNLNPGRPHPTWLEETQWSFSHSLARNVLWHSVSCDENYCEAGVLYDNGIQTGECSNDGSGVCKIKGWCDPVKMEEFSPEHVFLNTGEFSIFLDLHTDFPGFSVSSLTSGGEIKYRAAYAEMYAKHYSYKKSTATCLYDSKVDPYCPRFLVKQIVENAGEDFGNTAALGGKFKIQVEWDCNFDWGKDIFDCLPKFKFINRGLPEGKPKVYSTVSTQDATRRTVTHTLGIGVSVTHSGSGLQLQILNLILAAHFVYVTYKILETPFLFVARCLYASFLQLTCSCGKPSKESGDTDNTSGNDQKTES